MHLPQCEQSLRWSASDAETAVSIDHLSHLQGLNLGRCP